MDTDIFLFKLKSALTFMDLAERIKPVGGFLLDIQAYTLLLLAKEGPGAGAIVEIGSFMGKSTCCLALGSQGAHREKVYAVDHFSGSPEHQAGEVNETSDIVEHGTTYHRFLENIAAAGVSEQVEPIRASSAEAAAGWQGPIRLLFIDGDHSYEAAKLDFDSWSPHVVTGGIIAFHDIGEHVGVTTFYEELMARGAGYRQVVNIMGLAIVEKTA